MRDTATGLSGVWWFGRGGLAVLAILLFLIVANGRDCRAMCLLEEPTAEDYTIEEKKRKLATKYGLQAPDQNKSVMDAVMERKKQQYEECIRRGERVLRQLGQERYEVTPVANGSFKRDKITGKMWFDGPDGEREITIRR